VSGVNLAAPPVAAEATDVPPDPADEDDSILAKDVPAADGKPSSESISEIWSTLPPPSKPIGPGHTGDITAVVFTPDGLGLVTSSWDKTVRLWELASGKELAVLAGHTGVVSGATFAPDGETFATASWDKTIRVWSYPAGHTVQTLMGHTGVVTAVVYSPDGTQMASCGWDKTLRLWDAKTG